VVGTACPLYFKPPLPLPGGELILSGRCAPSPAKGAKPPLNPLNWAYPLGNERGFAPWFWGPGAPPLVWGLGIEDPQNLISYSLPSGEGRGGVLIVGT